MSVDLRTFECVKEWSASINFWDSINLNKIRGAWLLYFQHQHIEPSSIDNMIYAWKKFKIKAEEKQVKGMKEVKKKGKKLSAKAKAKIGNALSKKKKVSPMSLKRRKRSVNDTSAAEEKITTHTISIQDKDANSDFELSTCIIFETSTDGQIMETHAYDFERNVLIEDGEVDSGSNLTATYIDEDGVEVPADEETAPVIQDVTISISTSPMNETTNTTSPRNVSSYFFSVSDEDSSSDLELKDCRIWEKSEGEVIETHVYDFESNKLIEDQKVDSGSTLTATYTDEGGAEVEAEKEVTEVETISIVLRPR